MLKHTLIVVRDFHAVHAIEDIVCSRTVVVTPSTALVGSRYDEIYILGNIYTDSPLTNRAIKRWVEEDLPLKMKPGGKPILVGWSHGTEEPPK